jgi:hypothetical protein
MKRVILIGVAVGLPAAVTLAVYWAAARDNSIPKDALEAFEKATEFEMYSLDPGRVPAKDAGTGLFHQWKVLGKTTVKGDEVKTVRTAVVKGAEDSDGMVAACFNPRHAIRIVHDKKTFDLVICYECLSARVYEGDKIIGSFLTTRSPEKTLTKVLTDAKVPLPKAE